MFTILAHESTVATGLATVLSRVVAQVDTDSGWVSLEINGRRYLLGAASETLQGLW
ncbi:MAG TPA: hypothetical protein VFH91_04725 [Pyrinomonadaceae bacterium]|nr:hypothetical protein [Pyrinomonadaceae bacterium]